MIYESKEWRNADWRPAILYVSYRQNVENEIKCPV